MVVTLFIYLVGFLNERIWLNGNLGMKTNPTSISLQSGFHAMFITANRWLGSHRFVLLAEPLLEQNLVARIRCKRILKDVQNASKRHHLIYGFPGFRGWTFPQHPTVWHLSSFLLLELSGLHSLPLELLHQNSGGKHEAKRTSDSASKHCTNSRKIVWFRASKDTRSIFRKN